MRLTKPAFSYRDDPAVPDFLDDGPRTVMDANCALCAKGARWIARNDKAEVFRIISMQTPLGQALFAHYDIDPEDPASWLFLYEGQAYTSMDAVIRVGHTLGGFSRGLAVLRLIPPPLQDRLYAWIARNRYKLIKGETLCTMPDPEVKQRLII